MPEVSSLFELTTKEVEPDVDAWREQEARQRRAARNKKIGGFVAVAAILGAMLAVIVGVRVGPHTPTPGRESPTVARETTPTPFFLDLRTGERTPLPETIADDGVYSYVASPDGTQLAYNTCHSDSCSAFDEMFVANVDGTNARRLPVPEGLNGYGPRWSPDGTKLVYQLRDGAFPPGTDVGNLFVLDLATGRSTQLTDLELSSASWWFLAPIFGPDGRNVIFQLPRTSSNLTESDVWSVPVAGGEPRMVLRNATFPMFLPDGDGIAFVSPFFGDLAGSRIAIADGEGSRRTLVEAHVSIWDPALSPDGTRIAYRDDASIYVVEVSTGDSSRVADGGMAEWLDEDTLIVTPWPSGSTRTRSS